VTAAPDNRLDPQRLLEQIWRDDADKYFPQADLGPYFDPPLVAIAEAADPWFVRLQEHIGPFHWTPQEALDLVAGAATARSVVSYALPISAAARQANRQQSRGPAELWARVRTFGEQFNDRVRSGLVEALQAAGHAAVAPAIHPDNDVRDTADRPYNSRWSERHVAFVAGLGTFGISGGLITRAGVAVRFGSVVTSADFPATARPYGDDPFAWCLKTARDACGACIQRCPAGSIGPTHSDRDKRACRAQVKAAIRDLAPTFGFQGNYGCGLCQTAVPCEARNPTASAHRHPEP
jgi:epoxyqueuosine reductase QueG